MESADTTVDSELPPCYYIIVSLYIYIVLKHLEYFLYRRCVILSALYLILFVISFLYLCLLIFRFNQNVSVYYVFLSICIILINYAYWQISIASTLEEALVASRFSYLGSGFVGYFMICCIAQLCKTRIPIAVRCIGIGIGTIIISFAMTIGHSEIYYKSAQLIQTNGFSYLIKEYGPMHIIFVAEIILSLCYGLLIVVKSFTQKKRVSYISSICSLAVMASVSIVYFIQAGIYPLLPLAYDIGFAIILVLLIRISMYNTIAISEESLKDGQEYGFVNFDSKGRFLDGDVMARKWFPELNDLKIDYLIPDYSTDFLKQVNNWITGNDDSNSRLFTCGEQIIEAKKTVLNLRTNKKVFCIQLRDDTKQQKYTQLIENYNRDLQHNVELKTQKIEQIQNDIIISMASIVENRDSSTGGHIRRSSDVVRVFVGYLMETGGFPELSKHVADCIILSAPLHDFGKIGISDAILNKPGKYSHEEYEEMKKHSVLGTAIVGRILQSSEDIMLKNIAVNIAHYHHEKWDGSGYPEGLKGAEIPFEARIMALADVFDALVSKRVYKEQFSFEKAFSIIRESSGSHFDPLLCNNFLACRDRLISVYSANSDE